MRNTLVLITAFLVYSTSVFAQEDSSDIMSNQTSFSIYAGYVNLMAKAKAEVENISATSTDSQGGITLGLSMSTQLSERFYLQPAIQYANVDSESWLFVPVMLKYYVADKFSLMAGPQGTFYLEDKQGFPVNTFGLDLGFGAGFDITDQIFVEARYAFELTNRTNDLSSEFIANEIDPLIQSIDVTTKLNSFHIALGYRFK